jgi:hypothetical protein
VPKYMLIIFFYFLKIIFDISTSKRSKKYKPHSILIKKKFQNLTKHSYKHNTKQSRKLKLQIIMLLFHPLKALHDSFQWQGRITGRRNWGQVFYLFNLVAVQTVGSEVSLSKSALLQKFTNYWLFSVVAARYLNNVHGQQEGKKLPSLPCYTKHCLMLKQRDNIKCPFFIWRHSWLSNRHIVT